MQAVTTRNSTTHSVICRFSISPGALDHLGKIDTTALSPDMQRDFAAQWHGTTGMAADITFNQELFRTLKAIDSNHEIRARMRVDTVHHTMDVALTLASTP